MTLDNSEIFFASNGSGSPLLFIHGLGASFFTWRHQLAAPPTGWHATALDLPGFGLSEGMAEPCSLRTLTESLLAFMANLFTSPAMLCGHSFGALCALNASALRPDVVAGLILVAPPVPGTPAPPPAVQANLMCHAYADLGVLDTDIFRFYREIGLRTPVTLRHINQFPHLDGPVNDSTPCLVVLGEHDRIIPDATRLSPILPDADFRTIDAVGHCPHEEAPDDFLELLDNFLAPIKHI